MRGPAATPRASAGSSASSAVGVFKCFQFLSQVAQLALGKLGSLTPGIAALLNRAGLGRQTLVPRLGLLALGLPTVPTLLKELHQLRHGTLKHGSLHRSRVSHLPPNQWEYNGTKTLRTTKTNLRPKTSIPSRPCYGCRRPRLVMEAILRHRAIPYFHAKLLLT